MDTNLTQILSSWYMILEYSVRECQLNGEFIQLAYDFRLLSIWYELNADFIQLVYDFRILYPWM